MDSVQLTSLLIGITSSLVATAIFILLSEFIRKFASPWFADKIYRGVRIDGTWKFELDAGEATSENAEFKLSQWGNKISGTYYHENNNNKEFYSVSGSISNMYLMYTCEPKSNRKIDAAVGLMHIIEDMDGVLKLTGDILYQSHGGKVTNWHNLQFALTNS